MTRGAPKRDFRRGSISEFFNTIRQLPNPELEWAVHVSMRGPRATALSREYLVGQFVKRPGDRPRVESRGCFSFAGVLGVDDRFPEVLTMLTIPCRIHPKYKL